MKRMAYLLLLTAMMMFSQSVETQASDYLGDFCFTTSSSQGADTINLRVGISSVGGGHYLLNGLAAKPAALGSAVSGNLEIRSDGSIVASLNWAKKDDTSMASRTMQLNIGTDGSADYHLIGLQKVFGQSGTTGYYDSGTLSLTPCQ
ncbi:MAG TPA: hypothetical protein VFG09_07225 [Thermodesulfovibrionales bacterium]|nr:hypothetical protein [Thermodesulfovibrionales bacterium]